AGYLDGSSGLVEAVHDYSGLQVQGDVVAGFDPNPNNYVYGAAVQPDGKIVLGGGFTTVGGTARTNSARILASGSLDAGYTANANGDVFGTLVQADGK